MSQIYDVCSRKHKHNPASVAANERAEPTKTATKDDIVRFGRIVGEFTSKDVARILDKPLHTFSGRIAELKAEKVIEVVDKPRREGCEILRVVGDQA
jgi:hypothetical protein